jgi:hypothetical protein
MRPRFFTLILSVLLLPGCRRDPIETYRVAKQPAAPQSGLTASHKEITWKTPLGWKEQPPSAMRMGSFLLTGRNGQTADVSIIPLSGEAGGRLANINRWRGQINLDPITENDLQDQSETINSGGHPMVLIDFVSKDALLDNRYRKRVVAAIYTHKDRTWFFKLMGEDLTVEEAKPTFREFLNSLRFNDPAS